MHIPSVHPYFAYRFGLLAVVLLLMSSVVQAEPEARIYQLQNRTAEDMAGQIKDLYRQTPITVTANGQQLVVRGEPAQLDEIGTLIETLDVAPIQMRVSVRYRQDIGGRETGGGVNASDDKALATIKSRTISTASSIERNVIVQSGQSAHITSGQVRTLPFALQGGRNPAMILEQVETRSGFVVSPQVISERTVELKIVSFEEDPAALPGYETEALVTIRRVDPGQWVSLGGTNTSQAGHEDGITYRVNGSRAEHQTVEVKVDLLH